MELHRKTYNKFSLSRNICGKSRNIFKDRESFIVGLFRLPVLALPFSPSSSGRHFAGFPVVTKTPRICVNCALINEIMLVGMISELISRIIRFLSLFYSVNL